MASSDLKTDFGLPASALASNTCRNIAITLKTPCRAGSNRLITSTDCIVVCGWGALRLKEVAEFALTCHIYICRVKQ